MVAVRWGTGRWEFSVEQDYIDVTCGIETLNPNWTFTDENGHDHYYDSGGYPTLDYIVDAQHWCDGYEGAFNHDPHMAVDESHYECLICGVHVKPGTYPPYYPQSIPGERTLTMTGWFQGWQVTVVPRCDEAETLLDRLRMTTDGPIRDRIIDQFVEQNPERITQRSFTS